VGVEGVWVNGVRLEGASGVRLEGKARPGRLLREFSA
jgi:hypothetical protein